MNTYEKCRLVARSLISEIGPWGDKCVLFGGLVPGILVPNPNEGLAPHIGTTDVDLAIGVAALGDQTDLYRTLKNNLSSLGLKQTSGRTFEWKTVVEGDDVVVELFVPVDDPELGGKIQKRPIEDGGSGLTALGIYGLEFIERDLIELSDEGPLLDDKGIKDVKLRLCGPGVMVALKAWALEERNKEKDGYDVVWLLKAYGARYVAERFVTAKLHETDFGKEALARLGRTFKSPEHTGTIGWVTVSEFQGDEASREKLEAVGIVKEFLAAVESTT